MCRSARKVAVRSHGRRRADRILYWPKPLFDRRRRRHLTRFEHGRQANHRQRHARASRRCTAAEMFPVTYAAPRDWHRVLCLDGRWVYPLVMRATAVPRSQEPARQRAVGRGPIWLVSRRAFEPSRHGAGREHFQLMFSQVDAVFSRCSGLLCGLGCGELCHSPAEKLRYF